MKLIISGFFIFVSLGGCNPQKNKNKPEDALISEKKDEPAQLNEEEVKVSEGVFLKTSKISNGDYTMKIDSYYTDAEMDSSVIIFVKNAILKQEIFFLSKDSILKKEAYKVKMLRLKTTKGKRIEIQENTIYQIGIVYGENDWLYIISGGGINGTQSEFYGAYSAKGDLLWYSYFTYKLLKYPQYSNKDYPKDYPNEGYGDLDNVLARYKISEAQFLKPKKIIDIGLY